MRRRWPPDTLPISWSAKRLVRAAAQTLAEGLELDPRDPEPQIVAHALLGMWEARETSLTRHIEDGLHGQALNDAVEEDQRRAARLLETGLWAFNVFAQGKRTTRQAADAVNAMDEARRQIAEAMRQAREAWRQAKEAGRRAHEARGEGDAARRDARQAAHDARRGAQQARRAAMEAKREALRERRGR